MKIALLPVNEDERLEALRQYQILDTESESCFDELVNLAAFIVGVPISLVSLIDEKRQWFKAVLGLPVTETSRDGAFCSHAILEDSVMVVEDASKDSRFYDNPLVTGNPSIRFYAGAPLITPQGYRIGTLCTIDSIPREITQDQKTALEMLARQVVYQLEARRKNQELGEITRELTTTNYIKDRLFSLIRHDLKTPFAGLIGTLQLARENLDSLDSEELRDIFEDMDGCVTEVYQFVEGLLEWAELERSVVRILAEDVDLREKLTTVMAAAAMENETRGIEVVTSFQSDFKVNANPRALRFILRYLLKNAYHTSPDLSQIEISVKDVGEFTEVHIRDAGPTHSKAQLEQMFDIDYLSQHRSGQALSVGSGLEMVFSRRLAEVNGGELFAISAEKGGTELVLRLAKAALH